MGGPPGKGLPRQLPLLSRSLCPERSRAYPSELLGLTARRPPPQKGSLPSEQLHTGSRRLGTPPECMGTPEKPVLSAVFWPGSHHFLLKCSEPWTEKSQAGALLAPMRAMSGKRE